MKSRKRKGARKSNRRKSGARAQRRGAVVRRAPRGRQVPLKAEEKGDETKPAAGEEE